MNAKEKLAALRAQMQEQGLDAYIILNTDPHQSEYIAEYFRVMKWLTGFTGSTGTVVVTHDFAGVWTDSRYFIQAEQELKNSGFELVKLKIPHTPEYLDWLVESLSEMNVIGVNGKVCSLAHYDRIEDFCLDSGFELTDAGDLTEGIWQDRPSIPANPIIVHEDHFAGKSVSRKLAEIRKEMQAEGMDFYHISALDEIAWLYNLRGSDIPYNPVFYAYAMVGLENAWLFTSTKSVSEEVYDHLSPAVEICSYRQWGKVISEIGETEHFVLDPKTSSAHLLNDMPDLLTLMYGESLITPRKAIKNEIEIHNIKRVMEKDGIALIKFLMWLEEAVPLGDISETHAADKLEEFRAEQEHYMGPSFGTIAGYAGNGAIVHYSAKEETAAILKAEGIFLLDSGGQYLDGTTDITRTLALGPPTNEQKRDFTLVLKGHIAIATTIFPEETAGYQIEGFARRALWQHGLDYGHGTGHGVGFFLNVHEGPQSLGSGATGKYATPLEVGMLTSNEPGVYHEGEYGIRTENLILCVPHSETKFGKFYTFETVTLCPIDKLLIDVSLLDQSEIDWLNEYHRMVHERLAPHLNEGEREWLKEKTSSI